MGAALRVAEVAVETTLVALDGGAQPERVVHLVRVARGDVLADLRDGQVVAGAVDGRHPRVGRRRLVARRGEHGLLPLLEHREPGERQPGEGIVGRTRTHDERRVEPGRGLVRHEPGDPQAARGRALGRRQRGQDVLRPHRLEDARGIGEAERGRLACQVVEPGLDHDAPPGQAPLRDLTSSINAGRNCKASATTPRSASRKIGASGSLLIATMRFAPFMPTTCWSAPLIPTAM